MTSMLRVPTNSESKRPKFLAVEFEVRGHHADYVRNFAHLWLQRDIPADIEFLVSRRFSEHHGNVIRAINESGDDRVSLRMIDEADQQLLDRKPRLKYWYGWQIFCRYAESSAADHALLMYSDYFQLPAVIGRRSPCPFSAVYFRPTFHYRTFANYRPNLKQRFTALRKAWLLQRFLKVQELRGLYCLDPLVVPFIQEHFKTDARIAHLADSFTLQAAGPSRAAEFRASLGIEPDRKIFCLLGVLDGRKGPVELLQSVRRIDPEIGRHIAIVLLGYIPDHGPQNLEALAAEMNGVNNVQVVLRNAYIDSADVQHYYELSDVILTTYQRHMGSSSALIRAALARRPVLSSDFGLMGELVERRKLGMVCDSQSPQSIADGIKRMFLAGPASTLDIDAAEALAAENSQEKLAEDLASLLDFVPALRRPLRSGDRLMAQADERSSQTVV